MPLGVGRLLAKEKKPISPFLRAKHGIAGPGEGGSGINKHIRFDEKGEAIAENGDIKEEVEDEEEEEVKTNGTTVPKAEENAEEDDKSLVKAQNGLHGPAAATNDDAKENGLVNGADGSSCKSLEEGNEKENQDVNGVEQEREEPVVC